MNLKNKVIDFVKYQINDAKRGIDMAKAKKEISIFHTLAKRIGAFHGIELYQDDTVVQAVTGSYGHEPNAIFADGKIVINTAFGTIPTEYQEAIYFHELGHLQKNHQPNPILYPMQARLGFGAGLQMEYEADEFSALKGAKMLEALEYLADLYTNQKNRAVTLRIKRLKELGNVH